MSELSREDRDAIQRMDMDSDTMNDGASVFFETIPPGEEGLDISHEGDELEEIEDMAQGAAGLSGWYVLCTP